MVRMACRLEACATILSTAQPPEPGKIKRNACTALLFAATLVQFIFKSKRERLERAPTKNDDCTRVGQRACYEAYRASAQAGSLRSTARTRCLRGRVPGQYQGQEVQSDYPPGHRYPRQ